MSVEWRDHEDYEMCEYYPDPRMGQPAKDWSRIRKCLRWSGLISLLIWIGVLYFMCSRPTVDPNVLKPTPLVDDSAGVFHEQSHIWIEPVSIGGEFLPNCPAGRTCS